MGRLLYDHSGEVWNDLTLIKHVGKSCYLAKCICGRETVVRYSQVKVEKVKSCGHRKYDAVNSIIGTKVNNLQVLEEAGRKNKNILVKCLCDCGNTAIITVSRVKNGIVKDCGCSKKKITSELMKKHGESNSKLYWIWESMKARCYREKTEHFKYYGERGVSICNEWLGEDGFLNFRNWSTKNGYIDGKKLSIERKDINGNYEPSNCEWIPFVLQARNRKSNINATLNGKTKCLTEWCNELDLKFSSIRYLIKVKGLTPEDAIEFKLKNRENRGDRNESTKRFSK